MVPYNLSLSIFRTCSSTYTDQLQGNRYQLLTVALLEHLSLYFKITNIVSAQPVKRALSGNYLCTNALIQFQRVLERGK